MPIKWLYNLLWKNNGKRNQKSLNQRKYQRPYNRSFLQVIILFNPPYIIEDEPTEQIVPEASQGNVESVQSEAVENTQDWEVVTNKRKPKQSPKQEEPNPVPVAMTSPQACGTEDETELLIMSCLNFVGPLLVTQQDMLTWTEEPYSSAAEVKYWKF